ncbi:MAG: efflux RND transporter periplasmic adaptor subunit [Bacteroidales bacterium]|nr:efflux RND transporter periplasmic adaptor subunit [Bacteroidales bacterium]
MKNVLKYVIFVAVATIFVGTFVFLYKKSKPEAKQYEELEVTRGSIRRTTLVTGKIAPRNEVNVKPQINGIISELYKEAGQHVEKNEVIAKLTVIPDMSQLSSAESRVRLSEINLRQARTNFEREKVLFEKELVSADEYEKFEQSYKQAEEERAAAQDALEVIRDGVSSTNAKGSSTLVRSTITGLILDIPVKVGNSVIQANTMNEGTTVATVADMSDLIFDGNIDETEVGLLVEKMPVVITVGAIPEYSSEASIEYIAPKAVETNGANQFQIKAALKADGSTVIRSGYSANAEIVLQEATDILTVPESALEFSGDSTFVYLKTADGEYARTQVETGLSDGLSIEIKSGLDEGNKVRGNLIINFDAKKGDNR